jgi:hypothetical protein
LLSQNIQISFFSFYLYLSSLYSITTIPLIHLFLHPSLQRLYSLFLCLYIQNITLFIHKIDKTMGWKKIILYGKKVINTNPE